MRHFTLTAIAALSVGFAAQAAEVTVATAQGEQTVETLPDTLVVYDLAAMDSLNALGVTPDGGPDNLRLDSLEGLEVEAVGTLFEPDLEALAGMEPDLIIVGGRSQAQAETVAEIAPTLDMTLGEDLITDAKARITAYGTLFERETEAEELNAALDEKVAAVQAAAEGKGTALVVLTNGPKISGYGPGSRFGWIYDVTGMDAAIEDFDPEAGHGNAMSHELIAEANPDWLFVLDRGAAIGEEGQSAAQTLDNPLVAETNAGQNDQIVYLPAGELYIGGGGYASLTKVIDSMTAALSE
ncbi:siderophore ABC transporter substrate-binding protein [Paracoccaceae bacterium GXU_MW_L88]